MDESPTKLREKAAQCRRLATLVINQSDPVVASLMALADKLEARAQAIEAEAVQAAIEKQEAPEASPENSVAAVKPQEPEDKG